MGLDPSIPAQIDQSKSQAKHSVCASVLAKCCAQSNFFFVVGVVRCLTISMKVGGHLLNMSTIVNVNSETLFLFIILH